MSSCFWNTLRNSIDPFEAELGIVVDAGVESKYGDDSGSRSSRGWKAARMWALYSIRLPYTSNDNTLYSFNGRGGFVGSGIGRSMIRGGKAQSPATPVLYVIGERFVGAFQTVDQR